ETGDDEVRLEEPVSGTGSFKLVVGQDLERQIKPSVQLVLPLLSKTAGAHDKATLQVAASDQLLDQQARHDGLARAWVICQQEPQRLPRKHGLIDRRNLVRQRIDKRRMHGQDGIEQVREANPVSF